VASCVRANAAAKVRSERSSRCEPSNRMACTARTAAWSSSASCSGGQCQPAGAWASGRRTHLGGVGLEYVLCKRRADLVPGPGIQLAARGRVAAHRGPALGAFAVQAKGQNARRARGHAYLRGVGCERQCRVSTYLHAVQVHKHHVADGQRVHDAEVRAQNAHQVWRGARHAVLDHGAGNDWDENADGWKGAPNSESTKSGSPPLFQPRTWGRGTRRRPGTQTRPRPS
jgi:hypothetical protein